MSRPSGPGTNRFATDPGTCLSTHIASAKPLRVTSIYTARGTLAQGCFDSAAEAPLPFPRVSNFLSASGQRVISEPTFESRADGDMEDDYAMMDNDEDDEITQEDAWAVISAYFEEKGLVRQQLDSFDEFIQNTMQEIVDESADIEIRPEPQHNPGRQSDFVEVYPCFAV